MHLSRAKTTKSMRRPNMLAALLLALLTQSCGAGVPEDQDRRAAAQGPFRVLLLPMVYVEDYRWLEKGRAVDEKDKGVFINHAQLARLFYLHDFPAIHADGIDAAEVTAVKSGSLGHYYCFTDSCLKKAKDTLDALRERYGRACQKEGLPADYCGTSDHASVLPPAVRARTRKISGEAASGEQVELELTLSEDRTVEVGLYEVNAPDTLFDDMSASYGCPRQFQTYLLAEYKVFRAQDQDASEQEIKSHLAAQLTTWARTRHGFDLPPRGCVQYLEQLDITTDPQHPVDPFTATIAPEKSGVAKGFKELRGPYLMRSLMGLMEVLQKKQLSFDRVLFYGHGMPLVAMGGGGVDLTKSGGGPGIGKVLSFDRDWNARPGYYFPTIVNSGDKGLSELPRLDRLKDLPPDNDDTKESHAERILRNYQTNQSFLTAMGQRLRAVTSEGSRIYLGFCHAAEGAKRCAVAEDCTIEVNGNSYSWGQACRKGYCSSINSNPVDFQIEATDINNPFFGFASAAEVWSCVTGRQVFGYGSTTQGADITGRNIYLEHGLDNYNTVMKGEVQDQVAQGLRQVTPSWPPTQTVGAAPELVKAHYEKILALAQTSCAQAAITTIYSALSQMAKKVCNSTSGYPQWPYLTRQCLGPVAAAGGADQSQASQDQGGR